MSPALDLIRSQGIVAIVRSASSSDALIAVDRLIEAGLTAVEVSLVTPNALDVVRDVASRLPSGVAIGVGTVLTVRDVVAAAEVGATFVVSPICRESVIKASGEAGIEVLPGVLTPTEAMSAVEWGATFVKLFPAALWTPRSLREVLTALPQLQAVPTGGVDLQTAADWIRAGAVAVGIGSSLTRDPDIAEKASRLISAIREARRL